MSIVNIINAFMHMLPVLIADRVAQSEALYRDIDVTHKYEYHLAGKDPGGIRCLDGQLVEEEVGDIHVVKQKNMNRIAVAIRTTAGKETTTRTYASAYDGEKSLIREGKVTDKFDGPKPMLREGYFPHLRVLPVPESGTIGCGRWSVDLALGKV